MVATEVALHRRQRKIDDRAVDGRDSGAEDCRDEGGLLPASHRRTGRARCLAHALRSGSPRCTLLTLSPEAPDP